MTKLYDKAGVEYRLAGVAAHQTLVYAQVVDPNDGETCDGELRILNDNELRKEPPRAKVDAVMAKLDKICVALGDEIRVRRQELAELAQEAEARQAKIDKLKAELKELGCCDDC